MLVADDVVEISEYKLAAGPHDSPKHYLTFILGGGVTF